MRVRVECYAGYQGEETPRRIHLSDHVVEVAEVVDRWLAPDHRYFKVLSDDLELFLLRHDVATGEWDLCPLRAGGPSGPC